jgi:hypothetical protein
MSFYKLERMELLGKLIVYIFFKFPLENWDVIIAAKGLHQKSGLCLALRVFEQGGVLNVPHLLWHVTSVSAKPGRPIECMVFYNRQRVLWINSYHVVKWKFRLGGWVFDWFHQTVCYMGNSAGWNNDHKVNLSNVFVFSRIISTQRPEHMLQRSIYIKRVSKAFCFLN